MIHILIASPNNDSLMEFSAGLDTNDVEVTWAKDCEHVISKIDKN